MFPCKSNDTLSVLYGSQRIRDQFLGDPGVHFFIDYIEILFF
jgi:hypothetical protein